MDIINDNATGGFRAFAALVNILATTTKTNDKLQALQEYFATATSRDKVWVIALFTGRRPKRAVQAGLLQQWCNSITGFPVWLFEECYHTVGDLAETIALLLPVNTHVAPDRFSLAYFIEKLITLEKAGEEDKKAFVLDAWKEMDRSELFVFNKIITGGFRIGVSQKMMVNALAKSTDSSASLVAHRISGNWDPATISFEDLLFNTTNEADHSKPYPFYLAYALDASPETLGDEKEWQAEWKWDGIRGQLIKRNGELFVWSRGEELMAGKFPEYDVLNNLLADGTVLDGEIISSRDGLPLPFALMQTRIGRKNVTKKQLQEAPVSFFAYDLLEYDHEDWRTRPLSERRQQLEKIIHALYELVAPDVKHILLLSPLIQFDSWAALAETRKEAREKGAEGLMLKRKSSTYQVGRKTGDWWKWKIEPLVIDAVMIYAQKGHGRRSNLYTDYTFAVKDGDKLVTFTKAYSGLTDKEFNEVDNFVKRNSLEKFGPVRTVKPTLVFEIAFEGIAASNRHKSGVALRFPRINRWRKDKKADEINTLEDLKQLLEAYGK